MKNFLLAIFFVLCLPTFCLAAGDADYMNLGWRVLNFIIFAGVIWWYMGKKLLAAMKARTEKINYTLDEAQRLQKQAEENLLKLEKSISNVEAEKAEIIENAKIQAERTKKLILAQATEQAEQIVAQAQRTAENNAKVMLSKVRGQIADEICSSTSEYLTKNIDSQMHDMLIDQALKKVAV